MIIIGGILSRSSLHSTPIQRYYNFRSYQTTSHVYYYYNLINVHMLGSYRPKFQSRCMSYSLLPFSLFLKLTSQKPEIRILEKSNSSINTIHIPNPSFDILDSSIINLSLNNFSSIMNPNDATGLHDSTMNPVWYKLNGPSSSLIRRIQRKSAFQSKVKSLLLIAPNGSVIYNYTANSSVQYTIEHWKPLTSTSRFLDIENNKNIGLGFILTSPCSRIKSFQLSYAIKYSYYRDLRFILFLLIFFGFTIWISITPDILLNHPGALCAPDLKVLKNCIEDTYVYHICSSHPEVLSPCDCGEPLNKSAREMFPQTSFDPLKIENKEIGIGKMKTISIMFATIILSIALMESISKHGVYYEL